MSQPTKRTVKSSTAIMAILVVVAFCSVSGGSVFDDAKFKLDLRGDPNANAYIDAGEIGNAFDFSAASPVSAVYGGGNGQSSISAVQYASQGTAKYGTLPYVSDVSVTSPYSGSAVSRPCLVLPQETKTENGSTYWAENGILLPKSAVAPGDSGYVTIYARFKWDGKTSNPNLLVGNGWDGTYGNADNGISVYLNNDGNVGVLNNGAMPYCGAKVTAGIWYDLFVVAHNETINSAEKVLANVYLYKSNLGVSPTLTTSVCTNKPMTFSSSKTRLSIGCYLLNATGWHNPSPDNSGNPRPRAFRGTIADVMLWDHAITTLEMSEVMAGGTRGGEWQIGAANNSADEFGDSNPAAAFEPRTMSWSRLRKTLDASNPTLSIATTMTSSEHQISRALTFLPILSGGSAPVEVALNGTTVGEIDLASETSITLPKELWRHDGTANTITITRSGSASGTIQFDAISLAPTPTATSVLDDAFFKLDLRGGASTFTQPGDLGNAFTFSSASPIVGFMGDQRGPRTYTSDYGNLPAQETAAVTNPYYPYTTNTQTVLHFYQDQKSDTTSVRSSIVIPGAAPRGPVQTFYLRFRWDGKAPASTDNPSYVFQSGNSENGYAATGVAMYINQTSVTGNATTNACIGFKGSNASDSLTDLMIKAGEWNDVFVTFSQNAGNTAYTATGTLCKPVASGDNFSPPSLITESKTVSKALSFNTENLTIGGYHDSSAGATPTRAFRGLIADFMIWDRALTDEEKIEVMAGQHGAKWRVGAINGSADEFTDADPASVFEPQSMPWRQMRKTLDASHPTLALKSPLAAYETGKAMILHVDPIFSGTGTSVPVSVAVNGAVIGSFDLAERHNFIIEKRMLKRDGDGNVTVTLTRTETTGSVAIDAITLSGSWQITDDDGASNGMLNEKYSPQFTFAGDDNPKHSTSSLSVGSNAMSTNFTFGVWMPAGMSGTCGWKFRTKTTSRSNPIDGLDARHTVYVNGTAVGWHNGWFAANEAFTLDIPAGTLHDGMNYVQWVQTLPTRADQQAVEGKPGIFQYYDFWAMDLISPTKYGMVIIIR